MVKKQVLEQIRKFYPEYYSKGESYPASKCATIRKVKEKWGVLSNFGGTGIIVEGVPFRNSEQLYQMMKFNDADVLKDIWTARNRAIRMKARKWRRKGFERSDWASMSIDAMKFCLMSRYTQDSSFREALEKSRGRFLVSDESTKKIIPDIWGMVINGSEFTGHNLYGRLLMELRDNGKLDYKLPSDALGFIKILK